MQQQPHILLRPNPSNQIQKIIDALQKKIVNPEPLLIENILNIEPNKSSNTSSIRSNRKKVMYLGKFTRVNVL